jgi:hypothetical protein
LRKKRSVSERDRITHERDRNQPRQRKEQSRREEVAAHKSGGSPITRGRNSPLKRGRSNPSKRKEQHLREEETTSGFP